MRNDDNKINEIIEEAGWRSRQRARLSGMSRATKQAIGDVATAISGTQPASDAGWRGKYALGKQDRILNTLSKDIIRDLTKLGLLPKNGSPVQPDQLKKMLNGFLSNYTGVGRNQTSPNQPNTPQAPQSFAPSTPASAPSTPASAPSTPAASAPSTPASAPSSPLKPVSTSSTTTTTSMPSVPASTTSTPASTNTTTSSGKTKLPPPSGRSSIPLSQRPSTPSVPASNTPPADESIPNGATIKFKNGTVCQYDSSDDKWYIQAKEGGYLNQTPIDSAELQSKISNDWRTQKAKAKAASTTPAESTPSTPEASTPTSAPSEPDSSSTSTPADVDEPDEDIPDDATITDKAGNTYIYSYETPGLKGFPTKWYIKQKSGNPIPFPEKMERPELQNYLSNAWREQNKKRKKKEKEESEKLPAFESFKNFFLNKN